MNEETVGQVATVANLIEIGKRVMLGARSEDFSIPYFDEGYEPKRAIEKISEDFAAALANEIQTQAVLKGVK